MPKTNFCRGQRPLLPYALVKLGTLQQVSSTQKKVIAGLINSATICTLTWPAASLD